MNDAITTFLDHYLDATAPAHCAVMIAGPWGAGKSHFIKAYMERRREAALKVDPLNNRIHLYVSLNGIRSFQEVRDLFFAETNPALNSTLAKLVGTVALRAFNTATGGDNLKPEDAGRYLARDISGYALVFDDLERCAMPLHEIMGFINNFVEHEGMKVIILASENDINKEEDIAYRRRKEKLVGKTLEVKADPGVVYDAFATAMHHEPARLAVYRNKVSVLSVFTASGTGNLRSLRAVLEDFDRLVKSVDARLGEKPDALERLLLFMVATGVELRAASLTPAQVADFYSHLLLASFYASRPEERPTDAAVVAEVAAKYPMIAWSDSIVPSEHIARLFDSGVIDTDSINAVLSTHSAIIGLAKTPAWRRLWDWNDGGVEAYEETRTMILADLGGAKLVQPEEILHVAGSMIGLREDGDDLLDGTDFIEYFTHYVARLVDEDLLATETLLLNGIDHVSYAGLGYSNRHTTDFIRVREIIEEGAKRAIDRALQRASSALVEDLRLNVEAYRQLYEYGSSTKTYGGKAILQHIDIEEFANLCLRDGRLDRELMAALQERYARDASGALSAEAPWRDRLFDHLGKQTTSLAAPFQKRAKDLLTYWRNRMPPQIGVV